MHNRMPLVEAMLKYKNEKVYPFHTPGDSTGTGASPGSTRPGTRAGAEWKRF